MCLVRVCLLLLVMVIRLKLLFGFCSNVLCGIISVVLFFWERLKMVLVEKLGSSLVNWLLLFFIIRCIWNVWLLVLFIGIRVMILVFSVCFGMVFGSMLILVLGLSVLKCFCGICIFRYKWLVVINFSIGVLCVIYLSFFVSLW